MGGEFLMIKDFFSSIKVHNVGMTKTRIGNDHDGGYVALEEVCKNTSALYSFGVGDDIGFEIDFTERFGKVPVYLYDPTVNIVPENGFKFYKEGISAHNIPLDNVHKDSLLKIDVEWDEWGAIETINARTLIKFSQILIELHIVPIQGLQRYGYTPYFRGFYGQVQDKLNNYLFECYKETIEKLNRYFYIYHIHANNSLPLINLDGCKFPPLLELSLVRKDLVDDVKDESCSFPVRGIDAPNKTDRDDIKNYYPWGE